MSRSKLVNGFIVWSRLVSRSKHYKTMHMTTYTINMGVAKHYKTNDNDHDEVSKINKHYKTMHMTTTILDSDTVSTANMHGFIVFYGQDTFLQWSTRCIAKDTF